jgi:hypothetical protein
VSWWQIVLIVGGAVVVGLAVGYVLNHLIVKTTTAVNVKRGTGGHPVNPVTQQTPDAPPTVPDLFAEIEFNRRIASAEWKGELQPFQTRAWDNRGDEVHSLAAELRSELAEAYSDMSLANSITWLSTEMARRSPSLDESYLKLRINIAERLNRVKLQLTQPGRVIRTGSPQ